VWEPDLPKVVLISGFSLANLGVTVFLTRASPPFKRPHFPRRISQFSRVPLNPWRTSTFLFEIFHLSGLSLCLTSESPGFRKTRSFLPMTTSAFRLPPTTTYVLSLRQSFFSSPSSTYTFFRAQHRLVLTLNPSQTLPPPPSANSQPFVHTRASAF